MWKAILDSVFRKVWAPFLVVAVLFLFLGASGGSAWYWIEIKEDYWRWTLGVLGFVSFVVAIHFAMSDGVRKIKSTEGSLRITSPDANSSQSTGPFEVKGTSDYKPKMAVAWIFTIDGIGNTARYWPQESVTFDEHGKTWRSKVWGLGGQSGDTKRFGIFLVGPSGEKLVEMYKRTGAALKEAGKKYMPLVALTDDIVECHAISVKVK